MYVYYVTTPINDTTTPINIRLLIIGLPPSCSGSNVCVICEDHQLLAVGTEEGLVECFDPRSNTCVGILDVPIQQQGERLL